MLCLDIQQRQLVRQRCGTPCTLQQTTDPLSRILVRQVADGPRLTRVLDCHGDDRYSCLSCCRTSISLLALSILADRPAQSSHQECLISETQREDRRGVLSRRKAILPRDARRSREFDGGTGTVTKSQLSRICLYSRSLLQSQILSAAA